MNKRCLHCLACILKLGNTSRKSHLCTRISLPLVGLAAPLSTAPAALPVFGQESFLPCGYLGLSAWVLNYSFFPWVSPVDTSSPPDSTIMIPREERRQRPWPAKISLQLAFPLYLVMRNKNPYPMNLELHCLLQPQEKRKLGM